MTHNNDGNGDYNCCIDLSPLICRYFISFAS